MSEADEAKLKAALETADDDIQVDFSSKKKAKKKKKKVKADSAVATKVEESKGFNWNDGYTEYEYSFMLDRIEQVMNEKIAAAQQDEESKDARGKLPIT